MKKHLILLTVMVFTLSIATKNLVAQNNPPYWSLLGNSNATTSSKLGTMNTIPLRFLTKNMERMRIDTGGRIGIGTITPQALLDVNATSGFQVGRFNNNQSKMYLGLYKSGSFLGYIGSYGGAARDVDFGTVTTNTAASVHLTIASIPRLTINRYGNVGIGTTLPRYRLDVDGGSGVLAIYAHTMGGYGVYSVGATYGVYGIGLYGIYGYGTYGAWGETTSGVGVAGTATSGDGASFYSATGIGLMARTGNANNWAGVFNGNVVTTGTYQTSDKKLKKNIAAFSDALSIINQLKPCTYEFQTEGKMASMQLPQGKHYGLIAQDLEEVLPVLVKEVTQDLHLPQTHQPVHLLAHDNEAQETTGEQQPSSEKLTFKAVNYIELIPVLIKGIQEQDQKMQQIVNLQQQINDLKLQILELKQMIQKQSGAQPSDAGTGYLLKQNTPNPVGNNTNISYTIPAGSVRTELILTNSLGQTIQTIAITGSGLLNIDTSTLTNGVYFYSLVADGKTMITKKLVVSK